MAEYATKLYFLNRRSTNGKQTPQNPKKSNFGDYPQIEGPPCYEVRCIKCRKLGRSCWKNSKHVYDDQEWLSTTSGHSVDDFDDNLSLMSDDEYCYDQYCKEESDDQYCKEESDDDYPYYIYSDYEDTSESDNYSLYDPFGYYEWGEGDLYNSDGDPYDHRRRNRGGRGGTRPPTFRDGGGHCPPKIQASDIIK